jgi:hypothetical protein
MGKSPRRAPASHLFAPKWSRIMSSEFPWSLILFGLTVLVGAIVLITSLTRRN